MTEEYIDGACAVAREDDYGYESFIRAIVHDDRDSFYRVGVREADVWRELVAFRAAELPSFSPGRDGEWYLTYNGFANSASRRADNCRQINAIVQDIDFHSQPEAACELVEAALSALEHAWAKGLLPEPTLAIDTGCGMQLLYSLERSSSYCREGGLLNEKGLRYLSDIAHRLDDAVEAYLAKWEFFSGAEVDRSVHDASRVMRIPGTVNRRNGRRCRVAFDSGHYWALGALVERLPRAERSQNRPRFSGEKKAKPAKIFRFDHLQMVRLSRIKELQERRGYDCIGCREMMCFLFYNAAVQVYARREEAAAELALFNRRFRDPLPMSEVDNATRSVDKLGFYKFSSAKLAEKLQISSAEARWFTVSRRDMQRLAAKQETAAKRAARDARIRELRARGMTQVEIAGEVSCSERTVRNVLNSGRVDGAATSDGESECGKCGDNTRNSLTGKKMANVSVVCGHLRGAISAPHESALPKRLWTPLSRNEGSCAQSSRTSAGFTSASCTSFSWRSPLSRVDSMAAAPSHDSEQAFSQAAAHSSSCLAPSIASIASVSLSSTAMSITIPPPAIPRPPCN